MLYKIISEEGIPIEEKELAEAPSVNDVLYITDYGAYITTKVENLFIWVKRI